MIYFILYECYTLDIIEDLYQTIYLIIGLFG